MDDRIGLEFISFLGLAPVEQVEVAGDLGCRHIGIGLEPIVLYAEAYPRWSLRDDAATRRDLIAALRDRGVTISLGEGFMAMPGTDVRGAAADMDLMGELGAGRVNLLVYDGDRDRAFDQCAVFAEMAAARDMTSTLEFLPPMPPAIDLPSALAAVAHVGRPSFGVLVDTMHLFRSGGTVADVVAVDPALIAYVQLCDVPLVSQYADYANEARFDRLAPGDGELPLAGLVAVLPPDTIIGLEVPMMALARAGIGPRERLRGAVAAARGLLEGRG